MVSKDLFACKERKTLNAQCHGGIVFLFPALLNLLTAPYYYFIVTDYVNDNNFNATSKNDTYDISPTLSYENGYPGKMIGLSRTFLLAAATAEVYNNYNI